MTAAPFILCVFWCAASPAEGAVTVEPGQARLHIAGGWGTLLPTLTVGGTVGVAKGVDLDFRWETYSGLAHDVSLTSRFAIAERWVLATSLNNVFYIIEDIGGIESADAPVGNGLAFQPALHRSFFFNDGVHVALGIGLGIRFVALNRNEDDTLNREAELSLQHASLSVAVEWEGDGATTFIRFVAVVPIQADLRLLGYLPHISFGRSFEL